MAFRHDFKNRKYKATWNPLGWTAAGQYTIKTCDEYETPMAVVFVALGSKEAKQNAKEQAEHIVQLLNEHSTQKNN